jgi:hypothetical protein
VAKFMTLGLVVDVVSMGEVLPLKSVQYVADKNSILKLGHVKPV